jgi:hypothetical protein
MPRQPQPASAPRGRQPRWQMPDSRYRPARSRPQHPLRNHHQPGPSATETRAAATTSVNNDLEGASDGHL